MRGFTLVELLVVIAIIAVLIGLITTGLSAARRAARTGVCLNNMHQSGVAWILYMADHKDVFPFDRTLNPEGLPHRVHDWGGVHWYRDQDLNVVRGSFAADRPINEYITGKERETNNLSVFGCPADDGIYFGGITPNYSDNEMAAVSQSEETGTLFATRGTSYQANEWVWLRPGTQGWWAGATDSNGELWRGPAQGHPNTRLNNRGSDAHSPSRFILVGDGGTMIPARVPEGSREGAVINGLHTGFAWGWWHGKEMACTARLDGSGKFHKIEALRGTTAEYDFWLDPALHGDGMSIYGFMYLPHTPPGE